MRSSSAAGDELQLGGNWREAERQAERENRETETGAVGD